MTKYIEIKGHSIQSTDTDPEAYASSWSSGGNLNTAREALMGAGTNTAAICAGGDDPSPAATAVSEEYNGTAWTEGDNLNQARLYGGGLGTQTAAIFASGATGTAVVDTVESYNGTSWSEVGEVNTGRIELNPSLPEPKTASTPAKSDNSKGDITTYLTNIPAIRTAWVFLQIHYNKLTSLFHTIQIIQVLHFLSLHTQNYYFPFLYNDRVRTENLSNYKMLICFKLRVLTLQIEESNPLHI